MKLIQNIQHRVRVNLAVRDLSRLSDHVLLDIGIERHNIAAEVDHIIGANRIHKPGVVSAKRIQSGYQVATA